MRRQTTIPPLILPVPGPPLGWDDLFIAPTQDGSDTVFSLTHQASYHSMFGAVSESKHVFIQQGLAQFLSLPSIRVLEFGFGTGLNAFLSFLFAIRHDKEVFYTGVESNPLDPVVARKLNYPEYLAYPEERDVFHRMHEQSTFSYPPFHFHKVTGLEEISTEELFHCIFFDAFAPEVQPELWEQQVFDWLYQQLAPEGCLVTYCAKGDVRRRMSASGFDVHRLPGPPGKREMLKGCKPGNTEG